MNTTNEVKKAFGGYLAGFFKALHLRSHASIREMKERGLSKSIILVPDRMIDAVEDMLKAYRESAPKAVNMSRASLPVIFVAMAKEVTPSMADYAAQGASPSYVMFPSDARNRVFKMQTMTMDRRVQLAFIGAEETSVRSLATQFVMWIARPENRRFIATYNLINGVTEDFPVVLESNEAVASIVALGQSNVTALTIDLTLKETTPYLDTPESDRGEYCDDSDGYGVVTEAVVNFEKEAQHEHVGGALGVSILRHGGRSDKNSEDE